MCVASFSSSKNKGKIFLFKLPHESVRSTKCENMGINAFQGLTFSFTACALKASLDLGTWKSLCKNINRDQTDLCRLITMIGRQGQEHS